MSDRPQKKQPADYPQMAFRIQKEDKESLMAFISEIQKMANSQTQPGEKQVKKNELIVDALWLGLLQLKKKYRPTNEVHNSPCTEENLQEVQKTKAS